MATTMELTTAICRKGPMSIYRWGRLSPGVGKKNFYRHPSQILNESS